MLLRAAPPTLAALALAIAACGSPGSTGSGPAAPPASSGGAAAPVVQPGAPGSGTRTVDADRLDDLGGVDYTEADVRFMQGMIPHHVQALEMTALAPDRAATEAVRRMALRMDISQRDEIGLMARWLRARGEEVPPSAMHAERGMHAMEGMDHAMPMMPGMLSPEQMAELRAASGPEFDRLFLEYMIQHHGGAIVMVRELFATGGGQESEIFQFASHVEADQEMEIDRMRQLLARGSGRGGEGAPR